MNIGSRPLCLQRTREGVLQEITDWVVGDDWRNILWLHGIAGSGKSTIARTVSAQLDPLHRKAAFVFFERNKVDPDSVIQTIAFQLANSDPLLRQTICAAISRNRNIVTQSLEAQFTALIQEPLNSVSQSLCGPMVIIMDGLDEYANVDGRKPLLSLILEGFTQLPSDVRLLITSRREYDINSLFSFNSQIKPISLSDTDSMDAIRVFLSSELAYIRRTRHIQMPHWPGQETFERICALSQGLFVWASTLSRFLLTCLDPTEQLHTVISSGSRQYAMGIDGLYHTILASFGDWDEHISKRFREFVSLVVFGGELNDIAIDELLDLPPERSCRIFLEALRPLFDWEPGWTVAPLHASLEDYLTDEKRCEDAPWALNCRESHEYLAMCCFRHMSRFLRPNLLGFDSSYWNLDELEEHKLDDFASEYIPESLRYSTHQWVGHVREAQSVLGHLRQYLTDFATNRIFFWLEVLGIMGRGIDEILFQCTEAFNVSRSGAFCVPSINSQSQEYVQLPRRRRSHRRKRLASQYLANPARVQHGVWRGNSSVYTPHLRLRRYV